jgi:hypothetical protein
MIGANETDYLAYLTGFEKSNMEKKINEYTGKRALDFCRKRPNISFTDQITILFDVFKVPSVGKYF